MAKPKYDAVEVPISRSARLRRALAWFAYGSFAGALAIGGQMTHNTPMLVSCLGLTFMFAVLCYHTMTAHSEWHLTATGEAQKESKRRERASIVEGIVKTLLIPAATVFGAYWLYVPVVNAFTGRVTVYEETCSASMPPDGPCVGTLTNRAIVFIVHVEQQLVIFNAANNIPAPLRLHNCVVVDRTNWDCTIDPDQNSAHLTMKDGVYTDP